MACNFLQQHNHITPILFVDALSFAVEYETAILISALTSPCNIHSFQLEQCTFLSFTSQKFCINYMLPPICGCYSSDSKRCLPNVLFHIWKTGCVL